MLFILEAYKIINRTALEFYFIKLETLIKALGVMENQMDSEDTFMKMELLMRDNGKIPRPKEEVNILWMEVCQSSLTCVRDTGLA